MSYVPPSTWLSSAAKWLQEPGSQNLLAGAGAKLDPEGIGGALGTATIGYNQSRVAAARAESQEKRNEEQRQIALKILGLSPPGSPGPTKIEAKKDGNIIQTSDAGTSSVPAPAASTQAPGSGVLLRPEVPPVGTGTGAAASPVVMPTTTVTAQRDPAAAPSAAPAADPYARNIPQFDVRQIAPFLLSPGGSSGSLSGLTPEQINAIRGTENETERLRLSSFANIIQAEDVRSQINYREAAGQLTRAQADVLRAQQPHVVPKMLADIDQSREAALFSRQQRQRSETLTPLEAKKTEADISREQAGTALANAQKNRINELVQFEKDQYTANINQSNAAAGYSKAGQARIEQVAPLEVAELKKRIEQYVEVEIKNPDGTSQKGTATAAQVMNEINDARARVQAAHKAHEDRKRQARTDDRTALKAATEAKQHLTSKLPGGYAILNDESELGPDADMFHATSKDPYVYILEQGDPGLGVLNPGVKMNKRDLPKVDGHQYTARELYEKAEPLGLTVQQYLEQVFYPKLQQPVPWNTGVTSTVKPATK